jgi:rhamnulokinase
MLADFRAGVLTLREVSRFPNEPVRVNGALQWDVLRLWQEMKEGLKHIAGTTLDSIGLDTWGCDFALIGEDGKLLENPYHYRDTRTDGVMKEVFQRVSREKIYSKTGTQFLNINTLFQLYAACHSTPALVDAASALLMMPDLLNYWLTGHMGSEYSIASTSQLVDPRTRSWATGLMADLDLPERLFQPIVEPGAPLGELRREVSEAHAATPVFAPACHDTGSAFASVSPAGGAFLSSGTWSLLGAEVPAPVISAKALESNFTNEGGVCGTTRILKNIAGMWVLQQCMATWTAQGHKLSYDDLLAAARDDSHAFQSLFDPDHALFFNPADMPAAIARFCRQTGQRVPSSPPACTRAVLESIAFKYRVVLDALEDLTGEQYSHVRIVGGGSRNRLLNQFTADVTGRPVIAGPVEATALGNIAMQMLSTGAVDSLDEARRMIDRSFPSERFEPVAADRWEAHYRRYLEYVESRASERTV